MEMKIGVEGQGEGKEEKESVGVYRLRSRLIHRRMTLDMDSSDSEEELGGKRIDNCGSDKCMTCPKFANSLFFESHVTMRRYEVANKNVRMSCPEMPKK